MTSRESDAAAGILASDSINSQYEPLDTFDLFSPENSPCAELLAANSEQLATREGFSPRGSSAADCASALHFYLRGMLSNTSESPAAAAWAASLRPSFQRDSSSGLSEQDLVQGLGTGVPAESESYAYLSLSTSYNYTSPTAASLDTSAPRTSAALTDLHLKYPLPISVVLAVTFVLLAIATVGGNLLVILSVFTYKPLKNVQNFLIVSLAVADVSVGVLIMPLNAADTLWSPWPLGQFMCNIWLCSDVFFCTSSIINLSAIAIDRYVSPVRTGSTVSFPLPSRFNRFTHTRVLYKSTVLYSTS